MDRTEMIEASVALAGPIEARVVAVLLPVGATLADAVAASGLLPPGATLDLGVWGHRRPAQTLVRPGDRVEIYRSLTIDPKEARRIRAEVRKARRRA